MKNDHGGIGRNVGVGRAGREKRVLVTGGAGFIGSHLCEAFLKKGLSVTAFDMADGRKIEHLMGRRGFRFVQNSILEKGALAQEISGTDLVLHFAAIADPLRYVREPLTTLTIDLQGALNVLDLCAAKGIKVAYASTSEIYGRNPRVPFDEDGDRVLGPTSVNRWCYSSAKAVVEHYCHAYAQDRGLRFVIYRFFNVYGPRLDDLGQGRVIPVMLENLLKGRPVSVHGDGCQTRSFLYIDDAVAAIVGLALSPRAVGGTFNIGTPDEVRMRDLARMLIEIGGFRSSLRFVPHARVFGKSYEDIPRRVPDVTRLKKILGWRPRVTLREGLRRTIAYYRDRRSA